jgi:hypothetical protein
MFLGRLLLLVMVIVFAPASVLAPAWAGEAEKTDLAILRDTIRANKKALVAVNLTLTDEEAAAFWPVYDRYQKDLGAVNDRMVQIIQDYMASYRDLSNEKAQQLVDQYLTAEDDRAKIRRTYLADFSKALPGKKVARFYQIENKMDAVLRYDLAADIPVVEQ